MHNPARRTIALGLPLSLLFAAVGASTRAETLSDAESGDVTTINDFGTRLFARLANGAVNPLVSPYSIGIAMQMLASGAGGATQKSFRHAVSANWTQFETSRRIGALSRQMVASSQGDLQLANGIWVAKGAGLLSNYEQVMRKEYGAAVQSEDFDDPATVQKINAWFAQQTRSLIPQMLATLNAQATIVLANALAFAGRWQTPFDPSLTRPGPFRRDEVALTASFMQITDGLIRYRETDELQAVALPFAGKQFEMVVVLPKVEAKEWTRKTRPNELLGALEGFKEARGNLSIPKLKVGSGADLRPVIEAMGLENVFGNGDFSRLSRHKVQFDQVVHRVVLSCDERGATAAAATAAVGVRSRPLGAFSLVLDRPFILALRHVGTKAILIWGRIDDPSAVAA